MRRVLDIWCCRQKEIRLSTVLVVAGHSHKLEIEEDQGYERLRNLM